MGVRGRWVTLIPIRDMGRAIRFYTKTVGAKLTYRGTGEMRNMWASISYGGSDLWLVAPSKREKISLAYNTLLVKDIKAAVRSLTKSGVKFQRGTPVSPNSRIEGPIVSEAFGASAYFKDSEGNLLMLWQNFPPM